MKELLKSFVSTFGSTLLPILGGTLIGVGSAQIIIYIIKNFGSFAAMITLLVLVFLYAWITNAISDYRLKKLNEKFEKEYEDFKSKLDNLK
jgi:ABC-type antimicrobial peptide transport system permease subunit